jgi:RecA/RadA recombinase
VTKANTAVASIDLDKIINRAKDRFKKKDKGLSLQLVSGDKIPKPSQPHEFVYWPDSSWHLLTGVPGIPFGRICQIAGRPDSGKSTHAMQFMKLAQEQGHIVVLWDSEGKFDANRYDRYFGKSKDLLVVTSRVILDGGDLVTAYTDSLRREYPDKKILVVWDSVGGSISKSSKTADLRDSKQLAEAAKENGQVLRHLVMKMEAYRHPETLEERMGILLINQTYANIGSVGQKQSGGQKVEFHSSLIVELVRAGNLLKTRDKVKRRCGIKVGATCKKNHLMDGDDTIYKMTLDITAGGITVNAKDPANYLVTEEQRAKDEFESDSDSDSDSESGEKEWGEDE